jgi:hypothetical protein
MYGMPIPAVHATGLVDVIVAVHATRLVDVIVATRFTEGLLNEQYAGRH